MIKRGKCLLGMAALALSLMVSVPANAEEQTSDVSIETTVESAESTVSGWVQNSSGTWSYYENGAKVRNQVKNINGKYYGFNYSGEMYADKRFSIYDSAAGDSYWYRAKADGSLYCNQWYGDSVGLYYYYGSDAKGVDGFNTVKGVRYYFSDGLMIIYGARKDSDGYYYASKIDGTLARLNTSGWTKVEYDYYYVLNGELCADAVYILGGTKYAFYDSGELITYGYVETVDGSDFIPKSSGALVEVSKKGWVQVEGEWYYHNGDDILEYTWEKIDGNWYYFMYGGAMWTGWLKQDGAWYYLDGNGVMQTGWEKISGTWYYFDGNGVMQTGWEKIGTKWYYFDGNGAMQTGWEKINGTWYYFNGSGMMLTGWQQINNKWYFFKSNGAMLTGTNTINGITYTFDSNGVWVE